MLVQVTLENQNGAKYVVSGKLVSKTSTSITLSHSGYVHPVVLAYSDKILKFEKIATVNKLAKKALESANKEKVWWGCMDPGGEI